MNDELGASFRLLYRISRSYSRYLSWFSVMWCKCSNDEFSQTRKLLEFELTFVESTIHHLKNTVELIYLPTVDCYLLITLLYRTRSKPISLVYIRKKDLVIDTKCRSSRSVSQTKIILKIWFPCRTNDCSIFKNSLLRGTRNISTTRLRIWI